MMLVQTIRDAPKALYDRLLHMLVWHSTAWLESLLAWTTLAYGFVIMRVIPDETRRLLGNISTPLLAKAMVALGLLWLVAVLWHGQPGGKKERVGRCQAMAGAGFVLWLYLGLDLYALLGLRPLAALVVTLYGCLALGCAICWVRCEFVQREWTARTAVAA